MTMTKTNMSPHPEEERHKYCNCVSLTRCEVFKVNANFIAFVSHGVKQTVENPILVITAIGDKHVILEITVWHCNRKHKVQSKFFIIRYNDKIRYNNSLNGTIP